jgi:hypothetical protein
MIVFDAGRVEFGAFDRGLRHMAAQRRAVRHVESAAPRFGKTRAGGRYDYGVSHASLLLQMLSVVRSQR